MSVEKLPTIATEEAFSPQGCGAGTENACFALSRNGSGENECLLLSNQNAANMAGIQLGWRLNIDSADGMAWCPKGVLGNSKQPE